MASRAMWKGSISFGMVTIPVAMYAAVHSRDIGFNQINSKTGNRVRQKRVDGVTGEEVSYDDIVKGYEFTPGQWVTFTPDELDGLDPVASRAIVLNEFIDPGLIDPLAFDHPYLLAPDKDLFKPYTLLHDALEQTNKVGVGRVVMRGKEYTVVIWPHGGALAMATLADADEITDPADLQIPRVSIANAELDMAKMLIGSLASDTFEHDAYVDTYRERVLEAITAKAQGNEIVTPTPPEPVQIDDLLGALKASLGAVQADKQASA